MEAKELSGLKTAEAQNLLTQYGLNEIHESHNSTFKIFLHQFKSPLVFLLLLATMISFATGGISDGIVITILIILNTVLGFAQEYHSDQLFQKLKEYVKSSVEVIRDGKKQFIDKKFLVPGDIIFHKLGDIVAADCFVINQNSLVIDESSITGESANVYKIANPSENLEQHDGILFSGSAVAQGEVVAKVFATGIKSKFGQIADLSLNTKKKSVFQQNLNDLGRTFTIISILALFFILILHWMLDRHDDFTSLLLFTLAIAITIIPEALPVIATLTLAHGAQKLTRLEVIVKNMASIEDLGNIDIICTDKTGTLTKNQLIVKKFMADNPKDFFKYSYLVSAESDDPFDKTIFDFAEKQIDKKMSLEEDFQDIPFDPIKRVSARDFHKFKIEKGTPEYVLDKCDGNCDDELKEINNIEKKGFRVISLSYSDEHETKYLGTYFFEDEIKEDAQHAIELGKEQHLMFKIITGDSLEVAINVALNVNLIKDKSEAIEAKDLHFDDAERLFAEVQQYKIFARTDPVQKYKIIESLQKQFHVGYLGDGINDAPSLKIANVGMVVDTASDIAKANADIILLNKNLKVIVNGIIEGRKVFANIDKYLRHTLSSNFGNLYTIGIISLFLNFLPLLPIQILLNNLLGDFPCLAFATDNNDHSELRRPKHHNITNLLIFSVILGLVTALFNLLFFWWASSFEIPYIQSMLFVFTTLTELLVIFSIRTRKFVFKGIKPSRNLTLLTGISVLIVIYCVIFGASIFKLLPIQPTQLLILFLFIIGYLITTEITKLELYKFHKDK